MAIVDIYGAGASFPAPLYSEWVETYRSETYSLVRYKTLNSRSGMYQLINKKVDFGSTEDPYTIEYLEKENLFQFPAIIGGVVPVFRLEGISSGELKLSGEVLADIFMGKIKKWNDPKITILNEGLVLPNKGIKTFHRFTGSGTTAIFTNYLSKVSDDWKNNFGEGHKVPWITGTSANNNNEIANFIKKTKGSIGYTGYSHAVSRELAVVQLKNRDGNFVEAGSHSFQSAMEYSQWDANKGFNTSLTNQPGKDSWPITSATYIVIQKTQQSPSIAFSILSFFDWAYANGGEAATNLGYIPLPESLIKIIHEAWSTQLKDLQGNAVWEEVK